MIIPRTIAYGDHSEQVADLWLPQTFEASIVLIHGGFWRAHRQRDLMTPAARALSEMGFATWNIEYRRVGAGGGWPTTGNDVMVSLDVLAQQSGVDDVVLMGHSAGGHLALWAAGVGYDQSTIRIGAVVALAPVADLRAARQLHLGDGAVDELLADLGDDVYGEASPTEMLPLGVPQVIIHGDQDTKVPVEMSREYVRLAAAAGDPVTLRVMSGVGHYELIDPQSKVWSHVVGAIGEVAASS